jgi:phosphatidylserine decarboxylase
MIIEYKVALMFFLAFLVILIYIKGYYPLFFLRDPVRTPPREDDIVLAPADGTVSYIRKIKDGEVPVCIKSRKKVPLKEITKTHLDEMRNGYIIGIGMHFYDVHIQRAPISGKVIEQIYVPGRFLDVNHNSKRLLKESERNIVIFNDPIHDHKIICIQLAAIEVRRIISFVKKGEDMALGQRYGYVKFGSQVDIIIPDIKGLKFNIKKGDRVYAGESIIARFGNIG